MADIWTNLPSEAAYTPFDAARLYRIGLRESGAVCAGAWHRAARAFFAPRPSVLTPDS